MDTPGKILNVNFLGFLHWFMSIRISHMKDHSISVDKDRYATYIVAKYIDTTTVKKTTKCYKNNFPSDMIFTKDDVSTSDKKVDKLNMKLNIHYRAFIGSLIYLLSKRVYLSFAVHKLANVSSNPGKAKF